MNIEEKIALEFCLTDYEIERVIEKNPEVKNLSQLRFRRNINVLNSLPIKKHQIRDIILSDPSFLTVQTS